jgi:3-deoxy-D-manno-octulosonate 8-phosphate phosphatase KdsC-like HAD superfamily phosphatase
MNVMWEMMPIRVAIITLRDSMSNNSQGNELGVQLLVDGCI